MLKAVPAMYVFCAGLLFAAGPARCEMTGAEKLKAAQTEFRVCAAPDNLPFTNKAGEGFDNKIAELLAKAENKPLAYYWWPLRRGFINYTLSRWNCDAVLGVPAGYELTETTKPYYCSTYVEVRLAGSGDASAKPVGVVVSTPPLDLLLRRGARPAVYLPADPDSPDSMGKLLPDLLSGRIGAAYVWGPLAGYFASEAPGKIAISPLKTTSAEESIRIKFPIAIGVRHGDHARIAAYNALIDENAQRIKDILIAAKVPLVDGPAQCLPPQHQAANSSPDSVRLANGGAQVPASISPGLIRVAGTPQASPDASANKITCHGPLTLDEVAKISEGGNRSAGARPYVVKNGKVDDKTYSGWIRFALSCQQCHGPGGGGSALAPDLTQAIKALDKKQFDAIVSCGLKGNLGTGVMPSWENNPNVMPYIDDLWAYLKARSDGVLPAGRPQKIAGAD